MDSANEALKMAAAMLVFVAALTIAMVAFTKARSTADAVMKKGDEYKTYYKFDTDVSHERVVGIEQVFANLYSYYQTQDTILFYKNDHLIDDPKLLNSTPINPQAVALYGSEASADGDKKLQSSSLRCTGTKPVEVGDETNKSRTIYGFDINDEIQRQEQWTKTNVAVKQFIDAFVNLKDSPPYDYSKVIQYPNNKPDTTSSERKILIGFEYNFDGKHTPLMKMKNAKFIERLGEYNYDAAYSSKTKETESTIGGYTIGYYVAETNQSVSEYTFKNGGRVSNDDGNKKRVIQYIYIGDWDKSME